MNNTIKFKSCEFKIYPEKHYCETVFWDGKVVPAVPHDTENYKKTAREAGYGEDTWKLCVYHEAFHTYISELWGYEFSPTLRSVAIEKDLVPRKAQHEEEKMVLAFQNILNTHPDYACHHPIVRQIERILSV